MRLRYYDKHGTEIFTGMPSSYFERIIFYIACKLIFLRYN